MEIDVQGLSQLLAKDAWETETRLKPDEDLYNINSVRDPITGELTVVKEVNDHWSSQYWGLVEQYRLLIVQHAKPTEDGNQAQTTADRPEGINQ